MGYPFQLVEHALKVLLNLSYVFADYTAQINGKKFAMLRTSWCRRMKDQVESDLCAQA